MPNKEWRETDLWKFTSEHQDCEVESWGGYTYKNDGYTPYGYTVEFENKLYYFDLCGRYIKTKAL